MDNIKNDNYYIQKIQQDLKFIVRHMKNRIVYDTRANLPELNCGVCFSACAVGQCGIGEKS